MSRENNINVENITSTTSSTAPATLRRTHFLLDYAVEFVDVLAERKSLCFVVGVEKRIETITGDVNLEVRRGHYAPPCPLGFLAGLGFGAGARRCPSLFIAS